MLKSIVGLELMALLENVAMEGVDAASSMAAIRIRIHEAAQRNDIPTNEWRILIEKSVAIQSAFTWRN